MHVGVYIHMFDVLGRYVRVVSQSVLLLQPPALSEVHVCLFDNRLGSADYTASYLAQLYLFSSIRQLRPSFLASAALASPLVDGPM